MNKFDPKFPFYDDDSDYNTNANSYYKDLGRKTKLIKLLAKRIWEYENKLNETLEDIEKRLTVYIAKNERLLTERLENWDERIDGLDEEVSHIFVEWLEDGTLEQIINHDVLGNKADKNHVDELNEKFTTQLSQIVVNVQNFGAIGDGVNDDGPAIRDAYDYLRTHGRGKLYFPNPSNYYSIQSTADYSEKSVGIAHDLNNVVIDAESQQVKIVADVEMDAVIYATERTDNVQIYNITVDANNLANYGFDTAEVYTPYFMMKNATFEKAKEYAFRIRSFVLSIERCLFARSRGGFRITGVGEVMATSLTMTGCYALNNEEVGFSTENLMYSTFNSCASDHNDIGYSINGRGVTMNGCGSEKTRQPFLAPSFRGFTMNAFFGYNVGSTSESNPTEHLFEFQHGEDATISGVHIHNDSGVNRHYDYKLGLTGSEYGFENITVTDNSFQRHDIDFVTNYKFTTRPIKLLRGDETTKDEEVTIDTNDLVDKIDGLSEFEINHTYTINIGNGRQHTTNNPTNLEGLKGTGKLIIQGNPDDRKNVVLHGGYDRLFIRNSSVSIEFKDLTIENRSTTGHSHIVQTDNARHVVLNNVGLSTGGSTTGSAISATKGSKVFAINGTSLEGESKDWNENAQPTIYADETSEIVGIE